MNNDFQHGFRNLDFEPDKPDSAEHPDTQDNATDEEFRPDADAFMNAPDTDSAKTSGPSTPLFTNLREIGTDLLDGLKSDAAPDAEKAREETAAPAESPADTPGNDWARPVTVAHARYVRSWLLLLGVVFILLAFYPFINQLYWKIRNSVYSVHHQLPRTESSFLAISYEGVAPQPEPSGRFITTENFTRHIQAMADAGYNPITLEDVRAFYHDGQLLPPKAVLLTFENTHRSTYFEAREILKRFRWHAAMGVVGDLVRTHNEDSILLPYLKDMNLDMAWDLASESHLGTTTIPASPTGARELFFAAPQWIAASNRFERFEEFTQRINTDHETSVGDFKQNFGAAPLAFFFPKGNYGQFQEYNRGLREANLRAVEKHYPLAFLLNQHAYNDKGTDHRRLNRLEIPADWTPEQLLHRLNISWPVQARRGQRDSAIETSRWIQDWGLLDNLGSYVTIRACPPADPIRTHSDATYGGRAWIAGSDNFREGSLLLRFRLVRGDVNIYLHYAADDDWIRLSFTDTGRATVAECTPGQESTTLAAGAVESDADFHTVHTLLVTIQDNVMFVRMDNRTLFGGPVLLPAQHAHGGMVGVGSWSASAGLSQTDVLECHLRARVDHFITWDYAFSRDTQYIIDTLNREAFRYQFIAPPWLEAYGAIPNPLPDSDPRALALTAAANYKKILPRIGVHSPASLANLLPKELVKELVKRGVSGVYIDAHGFPEAHITAFRNWLSTLNDVLKQNRLLLGVRFPAAVTAHASIANTIQQFPDAFIVDVDGSVPAEVDSEKICGLIDMEPPGDDSSAAILYTLTDYSESFNASEDSSISERRKRILRSLSAGRYDQAAAEALKWEQDFPEDPDAPAFASIAYARMRDNHAAADACDRCLALAPGRIEMVTRRAELLREIGTQAAMEEAGRLLDVYASAFPSDARLIIAQARWLEDNDLHLAAQELLRNLVRNNPDDITSRLTLQSFLDDPAERYANMHNLLALGVSGETQLRGLAHDIQDSELLTYPESGVFFDFIRHTTTNASAESVRELYADFLPLTAPISEDFDMAHISDKWLPFGVLDDYSSGAFALRAASDMSEAYLRLKHSELLRDGFIDVTISESLGAFWLYARRSSRAMVRFGFDADGFLRIQAWIDGEARSVDSRAWVRPPGDITLRLEIRGDGAIGYINGKEVFPTPLPIPHEVSYGWWSVAPFSPELGVARARIRHLSAGPLRPSIVMMRETDPARIQAALDLIRPSVREISALAPVLFVQSHNGTIIHTPVADLMPFRMFCAYHRIRFIPTVTLDYFSETDPRKLIELIETHKLDGLIVLVRKMPAESWFKDIEQTLESTGAGIIVVQSENPIWDPQNENPDYRSEVHRLAGEPPVTVRESERGSVLLPPNQREWALSPLPLNIWRRTSTEKAVRESAYPALVILPSGFPTDGRESPELAAFAQERSLSVTEAARAAAKAATPAERQAVARDAVIDAVSATPLPPERKTYLQRLLEIESPRDRQPPQKVPPSPRITRPATPAVRSAPTEETGQDGVRIAAPRTVSRAAASDVSPEANPYSPGAYIAPPFGYTIPEETPETAAEETVAPAAEAMPEAFVLPALTEAPVIDTPVLGDLWEDAGDDTAAAEAAPAEAEPPQPAAAETPQPEAFVLPTLSEPASIDTPALDDLWDPID